VNGNQNDTGLGRTTGVLATIVSKEIRNCREKRETKYKAPQINDPSKTTSTTTNTHLSITRLDILPIIILFPFKSPYRYRNFYGEVIGVIFVACVSIAFIVGWLQLPPEREVSEKV